MLLDIIRTTLALSLLLGQALAAPAPITRDVTPNGQHEKGDGIDISIGIYGTKTRVHFDGDGTPSVPLWGVYGPNARDIRQGGIPDCWLDAAMVAVADLYPDFLKSRFASPDDGVYHNTTNVTLTLEGEKKTYPISYLDAAQATKLPGKSSAGSVFWWPAAIETAVQYWYDEKGKSDIFRKGGFTHDAIELLTGIPSRQWMFDDADQLWEHMERAPDIPVIITTKGDDDQGGTKNLISYHAYTVLSREEDDGVRYAILRNPWHDTQRFKLEDVFADMNSLAHYADVDAKPTNDPAKTSAQPHTSTTQPTSVHSASASSVHSASATSVDSTSASSVNSTSAS